MKKILCVGGILMSKWLLTLPFCLTGLIAIYDGLFNGPRWNALLGIGYIMSGILLYDIKSWRKKL